MGVGGGDFVPSPQGADCLRSQTPVPTPPTPAGSVTHGPRWGAEGGCRSDCREPLTAAQPPPPLAQAPPARKRLSRFCWERAPGARLLPRLSERGSRWRHPRPPPLSPPRPSCKTPADASTSGRLCSPELGKAIRGGSGDCRPQAAGAWQRGPARGSARGDPPGAHRTGTALWAQKAGGQVTNFSRMGSEGPGGAGVGGTPAPRGTGTVSPGFTGLSNGGARPRNAVVG